MARKSNSARYTELALDKASAGSRLPEPARGRGKRSAALAAPDVAPTQSGQRARAARGKQAGSTSLAAPVSSGDAAQQQLLAGSEAANTEEHAGEPGLDTPLAQAADGLAPSSKPAAQWDRTTDMVTFDWPAIEQTAAQQGANQVMAKLLIAARAEGANSRWPL